MRVADLKEDPIFVVGAPRSGTTLLAAILAGHSRLSCGAETQFFRIPLPQLRAAVSDPQWPKLATELLGSLRVAQQDVLTLYQLRQHDVELFLEQRSPSIRVMLESITVPLATRLGKSRWVEKSPVHTRHLETIRHVFPHSPILRIMRDPRDSAHSFAKIESRSTSFVANCHEWQTVYRRSAGFFSSDPLTYTLRYEDLVTNPRQSVSGVCEFLGERFEETMLDTEKSAGRVISARETWKELVSKPITRERIGVWQRELPPEMRQFGSLTLSDAIEEWGYGSSIRPQVTLAVQHLTHRSAERNERLLMDLAARRIRCVPASDHSEPASVVYWAPADLGRGWWPRAAGVARFAAAAAYARLSGHPYRYLPGFRSHGRAQEVCAWFLRLLGEQVDWEQAR